MGWFGETKREAWQRLCSETQFEYINEGFWKGDRVEWRYANWIIVLDTYTVSTGKTMVTYTRIRAPFVSKNGYRFKAFRRHLFSGIAKLFGSKRIEIGDAEFDKAFTVKGTDPQFTKRIFSSVKIREAFHSQKQIDLRINDYATYHGKSLPANVDELYFSVGLVIKDTERLKVLFELFREMLLTLVRLGIADGQAPAIEV